MSTTLIAGCGYVGKRLAKAIQPKNPVVGLVRSNQSAAQLKNQGIEALTCNLDDDRSCKLPDDIGQVYYLAPPPAEGNQDPRIARFLELLPRTRPGRLLYLSTTGVYGNCNGNWVNENTPLQPTVPRAQRRVDAERTVLSFAEASGWKVVILRVAGIYGPGKLPVARLQNALPMIAAKQAPWTNRIHVDDLVQTCRAAMEVAPDRAVYNVSDGQPGNMREYFDAVADHLGLPRAPVIDLDQAGSELSAGMRSYLAESRRIDNSLMLASLGITLKYPSLAAGLAAIPPESALDSQ
ncbi:MAG: SDR family oxidoreductase [bacterium]